MILEDKVNRKAFKNEYKEEIEKGLIKAYSVLYPGKNIIIKYDKELSEYRFYVYVDGFEKIEEGKVIPTNLFIAQYKNNKAIAFSSIGVEKYNEEYNDFSYDNYNILKDQINALETMCKMENIIFTNVSITNNHVTMRIRDELKRTEKFYSKWFSLIPISESTAKATVSEIKRMVKHLKEKRNEIR